MDALGAGNLGCRAIGAIALLGAAVALALLAPPVASAAPGAAGAGDVSASVTATEVALSSGLAERRWDRSAFRTTLLLDRRHGGRRWSAGQRDFTLSIGGAEVGSDAFRVESATVERLPRGGTRVTMRLVAREGGGAPPGLEATRIAEAYPGVAGFRTRTTLTSAAPLTVDAATLDEAAVGAATPTIHTFRAGADFRSPGSSGPAVTTEEDPSAGLGRTSRTAEPGRPLEGHAQWLSTAAGERSLFMVMERNSFLSSRGEYDGAVARLRLDFSRDVVYTGPLEEFFGVANPGPGPARQRTLAPGVPFRLEAAFTGFGSGDGDEPWQFHRYLTGHRLTPYPKAITFNSNGVDRNRISTGAKDDADLRTVRELAPIARRLGVETFILDDGWQAISGDWQPDSPEFPEPRHQRDPVKFAPRFPDARFRAVREAIAPMRLGNWMSPLHFHPASRTYAENRDWICSPFGDALLAYNTADPESGSNEPGIVAWGPRAIPHIESRIRDAIENWGVAYYKFDFMTWLDCANQGTDFYAMHDAFLEMVDRLQRDHPEVTFQIDETNDYRLFPFESIARGPSWFQNATPGPERLLHNIWNLSPYVPGFSLGQHVLGGRAYERYPVPMLMAAALPSHITFFSDIRELPASVVEAARPWLAFYRRERDSLVQMAYPLLEDPLEARWTALQPWDPDAGRGALLAFRQDAPEAAKTIALRNVPPNRRFDLFRGPDGRHAGTVTSAELTRGIRVELPEKRTARVLLIRPATRPRLALRVSCRAPGGLAEVSGRDAAMVRRVEFIAGGRRVAVDGRRPFRRALGRAAGTRVVALAELADGRIVRMEARRPACAAGRPGRPGRPRGHPGPRFTG